MGGFPKLFVGGLGQWPDKTFFSSIFAMVQHTLEDINILPFTFSSRYPGEIDTEEILEHAYTSAQRKENGSKMPKKTGRNKEVIKAAYSLFPVEDVIVLHEKFWGIVNCKHVSTTN